MANFIKEEFGFKRAAVLYDMDKDYSKWIAEFFKKAWEDLYGSESVMAFESFNTKDADFRSQLTKILNSGAEVLFTPQYYNEVALIVQQAHQLGWDKPIVGSDRWGSAETVNLCGQDCHMLLSEPKEPPRHLSIYTNKNTVMCRMMSAL
jgi:branched-chain amino acid transport system substrate-binding protein